MGTKIINGLAETFTLRRTRQARTCYICKASINKGDEYASITFFISSKDRQLPMPVCTVCASD